MLRSYLKSRGGEAHDQRLSAPIEVQRRRHVEGALAERHAGDQRVERPLGRQVRRIEKMRQAVARSEPHRAVVVLVDRSLVHVVRTRAAALLEAAPDPTVEHVDAVIGTDPHPAAAVPLQEHDGVRADGRAGERRQRDQVAADAGSAARRLRRCRPRARLETGTPAIAACPAGCRMMPSAPRCPSAAGDRSSRRPSTQVSPGTRSTIP